MTDDKGFCVKHKVFLAPGESECQYCEVDRLRSRLAEAEKDVSDGWYWYIEDEIQYGLVIAKLQREMGK